MLMKSRACPVPLLEFNNITVVRGNKKALDRLSLVIHADEHTAILGPNGSGKSSLIKTITRECYPHADTGKQTFRIFGRDRWDTFELRALLGVVSADIQQSLYVERTAEEIVLSGFFSSIGLFRQAVSAPMRKKARAILSSLGIGHLRTRTMTGMSPGEARKVLIARALCHQPRALILDEPTAGLDIGAASRFRSLISRIAQSGKNIVMVTHDAADIIPEINRVVMLKDGRLFRDGPVKQVLNENNLRQLFGLRVKLTHSNGAYRIG